MINGFFSAGVVLTLLFVAQRINLTPVCNYFIPKTNKIRAKLFKLPEKNYGINCNLFSIKKKQ